MASYRGVISTKQNVIEEVAILEVFSHLDSLKKVEVISEKVAKICIYIDPVRDGATIEQEGNMSFTRSDSPPADMGKLAFEFLTKQDSMTRIFLDDLTRMIKGAGSVLFTAQSQDGEVSLKLVARVG